jgi:hypothetical protein
MNRTFYVRLLITAFCVFSIAGLSCTCSEKEVHTWEMYEITLLAEKEYSNYYTDVTCCGAEGPGFQSVYGFWMEAIFLR